MIHVFKLGFRDFVSVVFFIEKTNTLGSIQQY